LCAALVPDMLERFERLLPHLNNEDEELLEFIPTAAQKKNIRERKQALVDFKSVTLSIQRNDMTINESEVLFQSIIDSYPKMNFGSYIGEYAKIIHNKQLESAIIKIQGKKEIYLTVEEKEEVKKLLLKVDNNEGDSQEHFETLSFAERALKRQRLQEKQMSSKYINTNILIPTSCEVERLFSLAKRVFSPYRRSLHPQTLETLLFLNRNKSLCNLALVALMVNEKDNDKDEDEYEFEEEW